MDLTLILGPMKSSKSLELIAMASPLKYSSMAFLVVQHVRNTREEGVWSRGGVELASEKVKSLNDIRDRFFSFLAIDEIHMFPEEEVDIIEEFLRKGVKVVISGLDMDYRGVMFPVVRRLFELGPREVRYKRAVCDSCKNFNATHTQIREKGVPVTGGLDSVKVDNGTLEYTAVCRHCFVK